MTRRSRMLADLEQDIRDHLEWEIQDNIDRGMSPEDARSAVLRKFGNVARAAIGTTKEKGHRLPRWDASRGRVPVLPLF